jgi:hypothetical protein
VSLFVQAINTPDASIEKIRAANRLIGLKTGCLPEEYDTLVVSREDKEKCRHIINVIIAKLKLHSKNLKPKDSGIKIPFPINKAISESIPASENQVWSMTVEGRLMKYLAIITKVNIDSRPKVFDHLDWPYNPKFGKLSTSKPSSLWAFLIPSA